MRMLVAGLLLAAVSSGAMGATQANVYLCGGTDSDVQVTMTTSSYTGRPGLSVQNQSPVGPHATGLDSVTLVQSEAGLQVTGFFAGIADATLTYTLIVPRVLVGDKAIQRVKGMLIKTLTPGFLPEGANIEGPLEHNEFIPVVCGPSAAKF